MSLASLPTWELVQERLPMIFPEGTSNRNYFVREIAVSTVFAALYVGAVEGSGTFLAPKHVYRMSDEQAGLTDAESRIAYAIGVMKPGGRAPGVQWYADTSREPIRDETLRESLVVVGAATERTDLPTTSSAPRYALTASFAGLFDPSLSEPALSLAISAWQSKSLTPSALARIALIRGGAVASADEVPVSLPNGDVRRMKAGPSSVISKAVIEAFAPRYLERPAVLFLSESGNKVIAQDDKLARSIGLEIRPDKDLPDIILADIRDDHTLLVFVEVVASDGPIGDRRMEALGKLATEAGFPPEKVAYVTAYMDRAGAPFRKTVQTLAWGSFAWFASEPNGLIELSVRPRALI